MKLESSKLFLMFYLCLSVACVDPGLTPVGQTMDIRDPQEARTKITEILNRMFPLNAYEIDGSVRPHDKCIIRRINSDVKNQIGFCMEGETLRIIGSFFLGAFPDVDSEFEAKTLNGSHRSNQIAIKEYIRFRSEVEKALTLHTFSNYQKLDYKQILKYYSSDAEDCPTNKLDCVADPAKK